jgi:hypothetical protein
MLVLSSLLFRAQRGGTELQDINYRSDGLERTFAAFLLAPAFPCGKGAGAGFFPLGGCH